MILYNEERDSPAFKQQFLKDYTPSVGMMFSEGVGAGFRDISVMLTKSVMDMDKAENAPLLTEEDWKNSKFYDETIKWDESFTTPKARLLKERRDRERELGFLLDRAGAGGTAAFYGGALVGTIPDPVNYIPFVGILSKAKSAAVLAKLAQKGRLGRAVTSAADAAIGTAAYQFFPGYGLMAERETYQVKYDMRDALTDLGLALGVGFGLGAALGPIHPKDQSYDQVNATTRGKRVTPDGEAVPDNLPPEPVNTAAQRAWDSTAPTDKVDLLRRKIAADGAGVESNVPVPRQKGAEQAIAQDAARLQAAKEAFADSQIINSDGSPRVMYHGTGSNITAFAPNPNRGGLIYFSSQPRDASGYAIAKGSNAEKTVDFEILADRFPDVFDAKTGKVLNARKLRKAIEDTPSNYLEVEDIANLAKRDKVSFARAFERLYESNFQGGNVLPVYINAKKVLGSEDAPAMKWQEAEKLGSKHFKDKGYDAVWINEGEGMIASLAIYDPKLAKSIYNPGRFDFQEDQLIPDEVWNTPPRSPEPLPPVDDTPTKQNLKRVEAKEVEVETQLDNIELTDAEALVLAELNKEVKGTEKLVEAVRDVVPCLLTYG